MTKSHSEGAASPEPREYFWACPNCKHTWTIHERQFVFFPCKCIFCGKVTLTEKDVRAFPSTIATVYED